MRHSHGREAQRAPDQLAAGGLARRRRLPPQAPLAELPPARASCEIPQTQHPSDPEASITCEARGVKLQVRHRTEREKRGGAGRARISQPEGLRGPNVDPGGRLQVSGAAVRLRAQACQVAFAFCGVCSARGASPTAWHGNDRRAWSRCTGTDRLGGRPKGVLRAATALSRLSPLAIVAGASARRSEVSATTFTPQPKGPHRRLGRGPARAAEGTSSARRTGGPRVVRPAVRCQISADTRLPCAR